MGPATGLSIRKATRHTVTGTPHDAPGPVEITFAWKANGAPLKKESHLYPGTPGKEDSSWELPAGEKVETLWVEYKAK